MATTTTIPVSEYLATTYRPDCDYIDGEIQERNVGERDHSDLQSQLMGLLRATENKQYLHANSELRVQVKKYAISSSRYLRAVHLGTAGIDRKFSASIVYRSSLTRRHSLEYARERIRDCLDMGVTQVWLIDSGTRSVIICEGSTMIEQTSGELMVPGTPVATSVNSIFKVLG